MTTGTHAAHAASVEAWRDQRYAALRRPMGWLSLVGLDWLRHGLNRVGSDPMNEVVLPFGAPLVGTLTVSDDGVLADGDLAGGEVVPLVTDRAGEPTLLELGSLRLCVIERGGRPALRSWDVDAPARSAFRGVDHWPIDPAWRLDARLEPAPGRTVPVPDVIGTAEEQPSPGDIVFEVDGAEHRLQGLPGGESGELWLVFGDATNGIETYGGGRFVYTGVPDAAGRVALDFNRAYNPPCVFTPFATCPLPWPANSLGIRIEAGERAYTASVARAT